MKKIIFLIILFSSACTDLDLKPANGDVDAVVFKDFTAKLVARGVQDRSDLKKASVASQLAFPGSLAFVLQPERPPAHFLVSLFPRDIGEAQEGG